MTGDVSNSFQSFPNLGNMSDTEIQKLAESIDGLTPGDINVGKIKDVLLADKAAGKSLITAMLEGLSADNPQIPPPDPNMDPIEQNLSFQKWIQLNSAKFPGQNEAENLAYLMNSITAVNAGMISAAFPELNDVSGQVAARDVIAQLFGVDVPQDTQDTGQTGDTGQASDSSFGEQVVQDLTDAINNAPLTTGNTVDVDVNTIRQLIDTEVTPSSGQVGDLTDEESLTANVKFAETMVESSQATGVAGTATAQADMVTDGPLPPLTKQLLGNVDNQLGDVSNSIQTLLASVPATSTDPETVNMKNFLQAVLTSLDKLRNLLREIANGNSAQARDRANEKMHIQIAEIKEQVHKMEEAEKAAKKQKTMGLVMKILGPILLLAMVAATIASGGLAGPFLALTVALFAVAIADQIVSMATGQGMFSRMFNAISEALPAGVAMAVKAIMLVAVIAAAVVCPANAVVAFGLAFQMVAASGISGDAVKIARDHGASDSACTAINWAITGAIAAAALVVTAGKGFQSMQSTAAQDMKAAANSLKDASKEVTMSGTMKGIGNPQNATTMAETAETQGAGGVADIFKKLFTSGSEDINATNGMNKDNLALVMKVGVGMQVGSEAAQGGMGVASGIASIKRADFEKQQAAMEAMIIELQTMIKALQKLVDSFLNGNMSINDFANSCTEQINGLFKGLSGQMTGLATAANYKG